MYTVVGITCLVAVAILEGVAAVSPDKQLENEKQIQDNEKLSIQDDDLERQAQGSFDNIGCQLFGGSCQRLDNKCDGTLKQGSLWCRRHRRYGCCIPSPPLSFGCTIDGKTYENGQLAEERCFILKCNNGTWKYDSFNDICEMCYTYDKTYIQPYYSPIYYVDGDFGSYVFSQYGLNIPAQLGVDITFSYYNASCVESVIYREPGITIDVFLPDYYGYYNHGQIEVNGKTITFDAVETNHSVTQYYATRGTVFMIVYCYNYYCTVCISGSQGLSVYVDFSYYWPSVLNVYTLAMPFLQNELYGLCDILIERNFTGWTTSNGSLTNNTEAFVTSWWLSAPRRTLLSKNNGRTSIDRTVQDNDQTINERSLSEIEKICGEMNKGPCTVLPTEKCQLLKETCVSAMSDAGIFDKIDVSESSE